MQTEHIHEGIKYRLSNENLKIGDKVYPISDGYIKDNVYIHKEFNFNYYRCGFIDDPHTILDLHHSDYKPYEVHTSHGYGPAEEYFKIIHSKPLNII